MNLYYNNLFMMFMKTADYTLTYKATPKCLNVFLQIIFNLVVNWTNKLFSSLPKAERWWSLLLKDTRDSIGLCVELLVCIEHQKLTLSVSNINVIVIKYFLTRHIWESFRSSSHAKMLTKGLIRPTWIKQQK